jgi:hypothetical protein
VVASHVLSCGPTRWGFCAAATDYEQDLWHLLGGRLVAAAPDLFLISYPGSTAMPTCGLPAFWTPEVAKLCAAVHSARLTERVVSAGSRRGTKRVIAAVCLMYELPTLGHLE